jgi:hypothetical protein
MEHGDHSECSIELLACPEHLPQQIRQISINSANHPPADEIETESTMFTDKDGKQIVGFCLWCNQDFYSMDDVEAHNTDGMKACAIFQELKDEDCGPPVLCQMLEGFELLEKRENGQNRPTTVVNSVSGPIRDLRTVNWTSVPAMLGLWHFRACSHFGLRSLKRKAISR